MIKRSEENNQVIMAAHRKVYDLLADEYEQRARERSTTSFTRVQRLTGFIARGGSVLELGCGVGQELKNFHDLGFETTSIELSPRMATYATQRSPNSSIIVGDFTSTHINQTYDAIFARAFIHLFPKDQAMTLINKIHYALRPGGVAFFGTTKAKTSREGWIDKADYEGRLKRFRRFWSKEELQLTLEEIGFEIIDYYEELGLEGKDRMNITVKRS